MSTVHSPVRVRTAITPCLWFDNQAEEAARFYTSIFPDSRIGEITRFVEAGRELHGREPGTVMTVEFELSGQPFVALNGGPMFKFSEAISLQVDCRTQEEVDYYWDRLSEGGDPQAQNCGWLKDKFGLSWQIVPRVLIELMKEDDPALRNRVMAAMMQMTKLNIAELQRAAAGA